MGVFFPRPPPGFSVAASRPLACDHPPPNMRQSASRDRCVDVRVFVEGTPLFFLEGGAGVAASLEAGRQAGSQAGRLAGWLAGWQAGSWATGVERVDRRAGGGVRGLFFQFFFWGGRSL